MASRSLSLAERDRRWTSIQATMAGRGLDCLVIRGSANKWDSGMASIRYVSQIGGNGEEAIAIVPARGEPTVFVFTEQFVPFWRQAQDWVDDLRAANGRWAQAAAGRVRELGLARGGRIGLVGVGGKFASGTAMMHDIHHMLVAELPNAAFEPASDIIEDLRVVKSDEELVLLRQAGQLCDVALRKMQEVARPGMRAQQAYGEILGAIVSAGGDASPYMLYNAGENPAQFSRMPPDHVLQPGDMVIHELSPKYAGYWSHMAVPVSVGPVASAVHADLEQVAFAAHRAALDLIAPGVSTTRLRQALLGPVESAGLKMVWPFWKGIGLEQIETPVDDGHGGEMVLAASMSLGLQILVTTPDGRASVMIGDSVAVTPSGHERLSHVEAMLSGTTGTGVSL